MTNSGSMKAVRLFEHGDPSVLRYLDAPIPVPRDNEVLIRVRATAINRWDLRYRSGDLPRSPLPGRPSWPLPFQLGRDAAGEIVGLGNGVKRWNIGDRVVQMSHPACGNCRMCLRGRDNLCTDTAYPGHQVFGGYAQYITRSENAVLSIPEGVEFEAAAATLWSYTTPLNCALHRAPVGVGDTVLITGASGGLAMGAAQIAKLHGATVIGTTTKPTRINDLRAVGYDYVLDSNDPAMAEEVKALTDGGADAVWDCVGGTSFFELAVRSVRLGGSVAILAIDGPKIEVTSEAFIVRELSIVGVRAAGRREQQLCMSLLGQGKISPVIDRTFPLSEAANAHVYLESGSQVGKILLIPPLDSE